MNEIPAPNLMTTATPRSDIMASHSKRPLPQPEYDVIDNFQAWDKAKVLLKGLIVEKDLHAVADIGGGANPMLDREFITAHGVEYTLLDISQDELDKAPGHMRKVRIDMTSPPEEFRRVVGENQFDLIFSHMFLEHVNDAVATHTNIHSALKPGGLSIHFFPLPYCLPLFANRLLPEWLSGALVSLAQPDRDRKGTQVKFPAHYRFCKNPSQALHERFRELGFDVVQHTAYIGHDYYYRFPVLRDFERAMRPALVKLRVPLTSDATLVLRKREQ